MTKFNIPKCIKDINQLPDLWVWTCGGFNANARTKNYRFKIVKGDNSIYAEDFKEEIGISYLDFYKFSPVVKNEFNIFFN